MFYRVEPSISSNPWGAEHMPHRVVAETAARRPRTVARGRTKAEAMAKLHRMAKERGWISISPETFKD